MNICVEYEREECVESEKDWRLLINNSMSIHFSPLSVNSSTLINNSMSIHFSPLSVNFVVNIDAWHKILGHLSYTKLKSMSTLEARVTCVV